MRESNNLIMAACEVDTDQDAERLLQLACETEDDDTQPPPPQLREG